jgi:hypothetical protein
MSFMKRRMINKAFTIISISLIVSFSLLATATPARGGACLFSMAIGVREPDSIGGVHVLYTTTAGPSPVVNQYWNQDHPDVYGVGKLGEKFGDALVWGDFDGNGFPDLAIGNPKDSKGHGGQHGSVNVLYGTAVGLTATGSPYFDQEILVVGMLETGDLFGFSLAAGDFNKDGYDDLAIGVPGEAIGFLYNAGVLDVLYGSNDGLTKAGVQVFDQDKPGVYGDVEQADLFGFSLAVGDFDDDGFDDLAVGVPYENVGGEGDAGIVNMLYGSSDGLVGRNTAYSQDTSGVSGSPEQGDRFGYALAAGDFDHDGHDDLAVGVPYEYISSATNAGYVNVLYGTSDGFEDRDSAFYQGRLKISGCSSEKYDMFGYSLAAGDFNADGYSDLAIGSPGESVPIFSYGGLNVMYGSTAGLVIAGAQWFEQGSSGVYGEKEASGQFAIKLAAGDLDGDGYDDLAVGSPYMNFGSKRDVGLVHLLSGSSSGLGGNGKYISREMLGGVAESYDMFGISLAICPFSWPNPFPFSDFIPLIQK